MVLALASAACTSSTSEPGRTDPPEPTTTESPDTTSAQTTTAPPVITTSTVDQQAEIDEAKALMVQAELTEGGQLEANGGVAQSTEGFSPFEDLEVYAFDDGENLFFYVEGPAELVREIVIEFDAVDTSGAVVADTSYVGDLVTDPPPWAVEAQNGNTVRAADNPPPATTASRGMRVSYVQPVQASGGRLGVRIPSNITTLTEFAEISAWIYSALRGGFYDYDHFLVAYEALIDRVPSSSLLLFSPELVGELWWYRLG